MKAKEYYEKYKEKFFVGESSENLDINVHDLLMDFNAETIEIGESRGGKEKKPKNDDVIMAILKEQNQKWNALIRIFERHHGIAPIMYNGYINFWRESLPEVDKRMEGART